MGHNRGNAPVYDNDKVGIGNACWELNWTSAELQAKHCMLKKDHKRGRLRPF